jgi:DNA-directed RNA polymerase subunit RPC12/RpoP
MAYRIPSDTEVVEAIKDALQRHGIINSQRKLAELVLRELRRHDSDYTVSEERIRRLAIENSLAKIDIHCRDTPKKTSAKACPVCGGRTDRIRNLTVYGGTVTMGYKCRTCGYWTGLKQRVPVLYVFTPKS